MVRVDSVRPFMVLVIFLICLHFNAEPHQTLDLDKNMEILWLDMSTLQRWTSSNSGLLYGNIMAGQLPQQTKFF